MSLETLLVILGMAVVTFGFRVGGFFLAAHLPKKGTMATTLQAIPALVLIAVIIPGLIGYGWVGIIAAIIVFVTARRLGGVLWPMVVGVVVIAGARFAGIL